jgi:DNA invertase Pin-like site-specific DNA recombinase
MPYILQQLAREKTLKMKIGYARVSTTDQHLALQIEQLKRAGCRQIFEEKISGAKKDRPELEKLLSHIRQDDILVVCKLDRLARSTHHLLDIIERLRQKGSSFCSLGEPWADTTTHAGKMIMTVFAGIAEFERDLIRERTSIGRKAAQGRGVKFGRPSKLSPEQKRLILDLIAQNRSIQDIAKTFKVNRSTVYRVQGQS